MSSELSKLAPPEGSRPSERRVGRGPGCRKGKVSGRGMKGQKARQPGNIGKLTFQGGQTPIQRRLPKRGFRVPFPVHTIAINVGDLEIFDAKSQVGEVELRAVRLVQGATARIKILGDGELTRALTVTAHAFSQSARVKIEAAGGSVVVLEAKPAEAAATGA
jgi:large subunit ribosomal protein L15